MISALDGREGGAVGARDLTGCAQLELVTGVRQLHPEDAMFEAMLRGSPERSR